MGVKPERRRYSDVCASPSDVHLSPQLQIGERNWGREKLELLERLSQERAQWEQRLREATSQQGMVGVCAHVCVCVIRRLEMKSDVLKSASYLNFIVSSI